MNKLEALGDSFTFLGVRPENSELSEAALEELCVALCRIQDKTGRPIHIIPDRFIFTEKALREFFGWTDEDFKA